VAVRSGRLLTQSDYTRVTHKWCIYSVNDGTPLNVKASLWNAETWLSVKYRLLYATLAWQQISLLSRLLRIKMQPSAYFSVSYLTKRQTVDALRSMQLKLKPQATVLEKLITAQDGNQFIHNSSKWPTWRTISSIICLFESSTCFEQLCAHLQDDNCINTTSGIITLC
jgi:hypothetical protein